MMAFGTVIDNQSPHAHGQAGDCVDCRKWYEALESWDAGAPTLERPPCGHTPGALPARRLRCTAF